METNLSQMSTMCDPEDMYVFNNLIRFLSEDNEIFEHSYISGFPVDEIIPGKECKPEKIIRHMLRRHELTKARIESKIDHTVNIIYYCHGNLNPMVFSNDMPINMDIQILCFMYYILLVDKMGYYNYKVENCEPLMKLMNILLYKYSIPNLSIDKVSLNVEAITLFRIAHSYPSVTLGIFHKNVGYSASSFSVLSSIAKFTLPETIFLDMTAFVLPRLLHDPIFAMLLAMKVIDDDRKYLQTKVKTSLKQMYTDTVLAYNCTAFPEILKLNLCRRLNIIHFDEKESQIKYNPYFVKYHAKVIIETKRSQDQDLRNIFSMLHYNKYSIESSIL